MPSNFEKRKQKEAELLKNIEEKRNKKRDTKKVKKDLTDVAFDVRIGDNGRHELITLKYNPDTKLAEVVGRRPVDRGIGILFEQKKIALKTLANI